MKKLCFSLTFLLLCFPLLGKTTVKVVAGSAGIIKENIQAFVEFDYSKTMVGDKTLTQYLEGRGEDFVRDWPADSEKAAQYFAARMKRKNKGGLTCTDDSAAPYRLVIHVETLDMGNAGAQFIPFASSKAGGVIMSGTVEVLDTATNEVLCKIEVSEVKGKSDMSETVRLGLCYMVLADCICSAK